MAKKDDKERLLRIREKKKRKNPSFQGPESWRLKRVKSSWRKPDGIDSAMRHHKRGWPKIVKVGYRTPKEVRGLTRNGMEEVLIHNVDELEAIDNETQVGRIASAVGMKKKISITNRADELEIKLLNRPEEALTFSTISEISEELLLEEDSLMEELEGDKSRKKKTSKTELTDKELAELAELEESIKKEKKTTKKSTKKKTKPKPKPVSKKKKSSSKKSTSKKSKKKSTSKK